MGTGCTCLRTLDNDLAQLQFEQAAVIQPTETSAQQIYEMKTQEASVGGLPSLEYLVQLQSVFRSYTAQQDLLNTQHKDSQDSESDEELEHHVPYPTRSEDQLIRLHGSPAPARLVRSFGKTGEEPEAASSQHFTDGSTPFDKSADDALEDFNPLHSTARVSPQTRPE